MLVVGLVITLLGSTGMLIVVAMWPIELKQQNCLRNALTISATTACKAEYVKGVEDFQNKLRASRP